MAPPAPRRGDRAAQGGAFAPFAWVGLGLVAAVPTFWVLAVALQEADSPILAGAGAAAGAMFLSVPFLAIGAVLLPVAGVLALLAMRGRA